MNKSLHLTNQLLKFIDWFIPITAVLFVNRRVLFRNLIYPPMSYSDTYYWVDVLEIFLFLLLVFWSLSKHQQLTSFWNLWRNNIILTIFLSFSIASILWTIHPEATLYRLLVFIYTILIAFFMRIRFSQKQLLNIFLSVGGVVIVLNYLIAFLYPEIGIRAYSIYNGAWYGLFWHKNHLGIMMALFNLLFIFGITSHQTKTTSKKIFLTIFYIFSAGLVFLSKSATAIILLVFCHLLVITILAWIKWESKLNKRSYITIAIFLFVSSILLFTNIDLLLGLLGKNSSLTGRIPMWQYLLVNNFSQHPLLGYGFGAIWNSEPFRLALAKNIGWANEIIFADNGYLDILLNQGIIGLSIFLYLLGTYLIHSIQHANNHRNLLAFLPLTILLFIMISNLSYSTFFEIESFFWLILLVFIAPPTNRLQN